jgi:hypothetical protein
MWMTTGAALAPARFVRHSRITQRVMLEQLLVAADQQIVAELVAGLVARNATLPLLRSRASAVTQ